MSFSDIPVRENGPQRVEPRGINLRTAGIAIESFLGSVIGLTTFTIANNQSAAANVTGLAFDGASVKVAIIDFRIRRNTISSGAQERVQAGTMLAVYKQTAGTWSLTALSQAGDDAGVEFSITSGGQVQYTSDDQSGTPDESILKYTVRTIA